MQLRFRTLASTVAAFMVLGIMAAPVAEAKGRGKPDRRGRSAEAATDERGNSGRRSDSRRGGKAAVEAAVQAEESARGRRRARSESMVGAGVGAGAGAGSAGSDRFFPDDDGYAGTAQPARGHETALLDIGRRGSPTGSDDSAAAEFDRGYDAGRADYATDGYAGDRYETDRYGADRYETDRYGADRFDERGYGGDEPAGDYDDEDPADEPPIQRVSPADARRVAQIDADVVVVDGRPRYHLPQCSHLVGKQHEPLPVNEAVELGFTPCAWCEPDSALLATAHLS